MNDFLPNYNLTMWLSYSIKITTAIAIATIPLTTKVARKWPNSKSDTFNRFYLENGVSDKNDT
jgi:hypothetical protein